MGEWRWFGRSAINLSPRNADGRTAARNGSTAKHHDQFAPSDTVTERNQEPASVQIPALDWTMEYT